MLVPVTKKDAVEPIESKTRDATPRKDTDDRCFLLMPEIDAVRLGWDNGQQRAPAFTR